MEEFFKVTDYFAQLKEITLQQRVEELVNKYGGLRRAARLMNIDPAYLWRLQTGQKREPSNFILAKLGLKKKVIYERY